MEMDHEKLLETAAELGRLLMCSGAEIYRVEESVTRLLTAYGVTDPQVFAIPNCLILSAADPAGHPVTRMRRIPAHGTDIDLLEKCNDLCRSLCATRPPLEEAGALLRALADRHRPYPPALRLLGYTLAPAFFTLLFGGGLRDGLCALFTGLAVGLCLLYGGRRLGGNGFLHTILCSAVAAFLARGALCAGLALDGDAVTIGVLMLLVPGVALTNAMRDVMGGDIYSGLSRLAEAVLIAAGIALGAALGLGAAGLFGPVPPAPPALPGPLPAVLTDYVLPCAYAFLACLGFTFVFNLRGRLGKAICGLGAALGWLVYLLAGQGILAAFLAALAIGVYAELMARIRRFPATGYLLIALLPLVPGGGIYYAMTYCLASDIPQFLSTLLHTLGVAAALAVGAMLALTLFRGFWPRRHH